MRVVWASHFLNRQPHQPQPPFRNRSEVRSFPTAPPVIEKTFDVQIDHPVHFSRHHAGLIGVQED